MNKIKDILQEILLYTLPFITAVTMILHWLVVGY